MCKIEDKLLALGLNLGSPQPPVANYLGTKQVGDLLFVSGRKSDMVGVVGENVSEDEAREAARHTVLLLLAIVREDIKDLDRIVGVVKLQGFIRASESFARLPQVLDGASELLIALWGEHGRHARTATGVAQLPYGAVLQLDMILQIK